MHTYCRRILPDVALLQTKIYLNLTFSIKTTSMKATKIITVLFMLLFLAPAIAQTSIGIPVQGIARDNNGTARINAPIILTLDLYYIENGNEVLLYNPSQQENLTTDSFGVFSTVVNTVGRRSVFNSKEVFLRITESGTVISNEALNSVPYALAADNGAPTGAIMPYVGATAPDGWLLCDGAAIPNGLEYDALKLLYGPNTPDLRSMFLRGSGANATINPSINASLNTSNGDTFRQHSHGVNINTSSDGNHGHNYSDRRHGNNSTLGLVGSGTSGAETNTVYDIARTTNGAGNHNHNVNGNTGNSGNTETRPMHYVVNYIIKL